MANSKWAYRDKSRAFFFSFFDAVSRYLISDTGATSNKNKVGNPRCNETYNQAKFNGNPG